MDRWLGAVGIHSQDPLLPQLQRSLHALCTVHPQLHIRLNLFDAPEKRVLRNFTAARVTLSNVPGMKALFWKRVLTPQLVVQFRALWLFDGDVAIHPSVFPLATLVNALVAVDASAAQPAIRAGHAGLTTFQGHLVHKRPVSASCVITTAKSVEIMTPLFQTDGWAAFHEQVLTTIPDDKLAASAHGIDRMWCSWLRVAFPARPACVVVHSEVALHADSRSMRRYMNATAFRQGKSCSGTCQTLQRAFPGHFDSTKHDTGDCWKQTYAGPVRTTLLRSLDESGAISGRQRAGNGKDLDWGMEARWLGAASLIDRRLRPGEVDELLKALHLLCIAYPALRVLLHASEQTLPSFKLSDQRVRASRVAGSRASFWRAALRPRLMRQFEVLWLFDPRLIVHPSAFPIGMLVAGLQPTDGMAVQPLINAQPNISSRCVVRPTRRLDARCVLFRAQGWASFHANVLRQLHASQLPDLEGLIADVACSSLEAAERRMAERQSNYRERPACLVHGFAVATVRQTRRTLNEWPCRAHAQGASAESNPSSSCRIARGRFARLLNSTDHGKARCWDPSQKRGLVLGRNMGSRGE